MFLVGCEDQAFGGIPLLREGGKSGEQRRKQKRCESPRIGFIKLEKSSVHRRNFKASLGWVVARLQFETGSRKGNRGPFQAFHFRTMFPDFQKLVLGQVRKYLSRATRRPKDVQIQNARRFAQANVLFERRSPE
jgi:hypothetical protein